MELTLKVEDLTENQRKDLADRLGWGDAELSERLEQVATAAYSDYLEMIQGAPLPGRIGEMKEKRLLYLLKSYAKAGALFSEHEIAVMFQMSEQESARLLRDVRAHYHNELDSRVREAAKKILESAREVNGGFRVQVTSYNLLDALRSTVTIRAPHLGQIAKFRASAAQYDIPPDTYNVLCEEYGATSVAGK